MKAVTLALLALVASPASAETLTIDAPWFGPTFGRHMGVIHSVRFDYTVHSIIGFYNSNAEPVTLDIGAAPFIQFVTTHWGDGSWQATYFLGDQVDLGPLTIQPGSPNFEIDLKGSYTFTGAAVDQFYVDRVDWDDEQQFVSIVPWSGDVVLYGWENNGLEPGDSGGFLGTEGKLTFNYSVPEPSTWATVVLGFAAIGYGLRRKRISFAAASQRS
jgi:hypothetical protein